MPVPKGDGAIVNNTWEIVAEDGITAVLLTKMLPAAEVSWARYQDKKEIV